MESPNSDEKTYTVVHCINMYFVILLRKPPTPLFPRCTFIPQLLHQALVTSAGAVWLVPNPTSLSKFCSGEACNHYMAALCSFVGQRGARVFILLYSKGTLANDLVCNVYMSLYIVSGLKVSLLLAGTGRFYP